MSAERPRITVAEIVGSTRAAFGPVDSACLLRPDLFGGLLEDLELMAPWNVVIEPDVLTSHQYDPDGHWTLTIRPSPSEHFGVVGPVEAVVTLLDPELSIDLAPDNEDEPEAQA